MEFIVSSIQSFSSHIVPMVILLGLLIFVHESGHFLVAKYFKVKVETFSLGFGPKLFQFKRGDTVYAISAIPLGGYVKMFGDDPTAEISADERHHSFTHKPVSQRIAVVLAGPLMNFFFAILLFASIALIGEPTLSPVLGDLSPSTEAAKVGFQSGDTITAVNSAPIHSWDELQQVVEHSGDQMLSFDVHHEDGKTAVVKVAPKTVLNPNVMSWDHNIGEIDGLVSGSRASVIGMTDSKPDAKTPAALAGLMTGDVVTSIGDVKITKWREFLRELAKHSGDDSVKLTVERGTFETPQPKDPISKNLTLSLSSVKNQPAEEMIKGLGIEFPELYLAEMEKNAPAARAGLERGDRILSIDGEKVGSFDQVANLVRGFGKKSASAAATTDNKIDGRPVPLSIVVDRHGETKTFAVVPNVKTRMSNMGSEEQHFEIGIHPMIVEAIPQTFKWSTSSPLIALEHGVTQTVKWSSLTVLSFVRLFQGKVSAKNIGGFLSIGQMAKKSWQMGASQFLMAMAFISINLFVLNLLPVPVLDGGHLVFYSIELIKGAPLSMRKMEIAQQVGLALLLGLMVFALFNDFSRIFGGG